MDNQHQFIVLDVMDDSIEKCIAHLQLSVLH